MDWISCVWVFYYAVSFDTAEGRGAFTPPVARRRSHIAGAV